MSFCQYCGQQNPESSKFCFSCGKPIGMVEPANQPQTPLQNDIPVSENVDATVGVNTPYNKPVFENPAPMQMNTPYNEPAFEAPAPMQMNAPYNEPAFEAPAPMQKNMPYNEPSYQPAYGDQMNTPYSINGAEPVKPKKNKTPIIAVCAIVVILLAAAAALIFTHTICIMHEYSNATCETAAVCKHCGKEDQAALGHSWKDATCIEAKTCDRCAITEGEALGHDWQGGSCTVPDSCSRCGVSGDVPGHTAGEWTTVSVASLVSKGKEKLTCSSCGTQMETRETDVKDAAVSGATFNFTEDELVEWLVEDFGYDLSSDTKYIDGWGYAYDVYSTGGTDSSYGLLFIESGSNGKVDAIGICLDNNQTSLTKMLVLATMIDEENFSSLDAIDPILENSFYSQASMTVIYREVESGVYMCLLSTDEWFEANS